MNYILSLQKPKYLMQIFEICIRKSALMFFFLNIVEKPSEIKSRDDV